MFKQIPFDLPYVDQMIMCTKRLMSKDVGQEEKQDAWDRLVAIEGTGYGSEAFPKMVENGESKFPDFLKEKTVVFLKEIEKRKRFVHDPM